MMLSLWLGACAGGGDGGTSAWDPLADDTDAASTGGDEEASTGSADETTGGGTSGTIPGCTPGETIACECPDGSMGMHVCNPEGDGYYPCECSDGGSSDGGDETTGDEPPPPMGNVVCYPGQSGDFSTCLPIHEFAPLPAGYEYPPPYMGDPNYRSPVALLDLEELDPATYLAPNFQLGEIAQADKGRYAVVQVHAIVSLQALRDQVGALGVNSGYRSPAYNASVPGSATYSRHMYGDAYDLNPLEVGLGTLENACTSHGGMLVEYTTHVHCDFRFDPVDEEFFGMAMDGGEGERPQFQATLEPGDDGVWRAPAEGFDEGEPLREWTALDASGQVLLTITATDFVAPPGAASVRVRVGARLERTMAVP
ncbi:D-Ala-D-Ala carboxypeptidase family metallohydrolase [Paraliomyxa miuraensis]|uniref:D-Ala-D-Ala carboxypeptidase family metallohydrolase n=1 Tax=Paraliomyxa miuraensis TaxID=376150 RepID=UPI00225C28CF|nr:D-Ala-D-Ala carboxypeptidase family metallohydrolase [Paraliomyxa miuraensis]MCX4241883.1 D-Ala-D-Ala carboxypeptidase family metallohydrolase [Paraliomyxa miuraensis]